VQCYQLFQELLQVYNLDMSKHLHLLSFNHKDNQSECLAQEYNFNSNNNITLNHNSYLLLTVFNNLEIFLNLHPKFHQCKYAISSSHWHNNFWNNPISSHNFTKNNFTVNNLQVANLSKKILLLPMVPLMNSEIDSLRMLK